LLIIGFINTFIKNGTFTSGGHAAAGEVLIFTGY
jgi:hypothetical protein